ncbi:TetR/AcrR family transcriptional regulator [Sphingopyxis sp. USTB-05]|uniref:TetR/AcrR family transcriptional regulator n=1 Tax=Sphingopyxis sp. USTB-05 TaxID=2830667 RepID=UPI002078D4D9|nr:TetR/AcrR family transcriptional regulator [Sphingopyxis sp. USTB-05]USI78643.1 TetR/AcrR family transcriptional regulator [Sphingopyxis sp. USTB-05]
MATRTITKPRGRPNNRFGDRRIEVLRTAARVFSDLGFRQATLEDVAREIGMTRAALYHYSQSKDALLTACGDIARQELMEAVGHARREADGRARLTAFFQRYAEIVSEDFGRCFVLTDASEMAEDERTTSRKAQLALGNAAAEMIAEGIADGSLRSCDPRVASRLLFAAFNGVARWRNPPKDVAADFLDILFDGLAPRG